MTQNNIYNNYIIYKGKSNNCSTQKDRRSRMRLYGHVKPQTAAWLNETRAWRCAMQKTPRLNTDVGKKALEMQLTGKRQRGRQKRMYLDVVKEVGALEDEVFARSVSIIRCGDP